MDAKTITRKKRLPFARYIAEKEQVISCQSLCVSLTLSEHPGNFPFSRFLREEKERKPCMHASSKCENERKERALSEWEDWN